MEMHELLCLIKSARRKKRLVKTDRDKQLVQLYKRRKLLWQQQRKLPWVALEHPYQSGWKRFFVLRHDLKHGPGAAFYEALLLKINTVEYHHDKTFKRKKYRKQRFRYYVKEQQLREFYTYSWSDNKMELSEAEKALFNRVETIDMNTGRMQVRYVFTEPWRYVLKIVPNIITHTKPVDAELESELAQIVGHVKGHSLEYRIHRLTSGRSYRRGEWYYEPGKYINNLKNIPRYSPKDAYLD